MSRPVISVENISKRYQLGVINTGTFYGDLKRWWARQRGIPDPYLKIGEADHGNRQGEIIWALKDISFTVEQGEAIGIIGRNGAGKSTLLKILSRVTTPTTGAIKIKGRIASLLEVGTGFHPELTGRENIYLNGAIMGMSRTEVSRKFDEIVDFSGVEKFINTPVKRYSSGMYVRLAFAVAAHLEPEILVVDEVLAVGDAEFQKKCLGKMGDVTHHGRTVLFVSHNMLAIKQLCSKGILLSKGKSAYFGDIYTCAQQYIETTAQKTGSLLHHGFGEPGDYITIDQISINGSTIDELVLSGEERVLNIRMSGSIHHPTRLALEAKLLDGTGTAIGTFGPAHFNPEKAKDKLQTGPFLLKGSIRLPILTEGIFFLSIFLTDPVVRGLWSFPHALTLRVESIPMSNRTTTLKMSEGHGAIIMEGDFSTNQ